jgi:hypothetical protein
MLDALFTTVYTGLRKEWKSIPWTVFSVVMVWGVIVAFYFLIYPEIARTQDVKPIDLKVQSIETRLLDREILALLSQRCQASQKQFLTDRLSQLYGEYFTKTGHAYPLEPKCEDLH